jgi:hypothetical protein
VLVQAFPRDATRPYVGLAANASKGWRPKDRLEIGGEEFTVVCARPAFDTVACGADGAVASFDIVLVDRRPEQTIPTGTAVNHTPRR